MTSQVILKKKMSFISGAFNAFTNNKGRWPDMLYMVSLVATSVAKGTERWKHNIKQCRCYNKYITIFGLGSMLHFQNFRLVALLIGRSTYRTPNSSEQSRDNNVFGLFKRDTPLMCMSRICSVTCITFYYIKGINRNDSHFEGSCERFFFFFFSSKRYYNVL